MLVLGIESSCDETAIAIVQDGHKVLANEISSQVHKHKNYGGVVPELAAREHTKNIKYLFDLALKNADINFSSIDCFAVTTSPGLINCLLVGYSFASGLALSSQKKLLKINHLHGHLFSCFLDNQKLFKDKSSFPMVILLISGGHTNLYILESDGQCQSMGTTIDDACGEAFDKAGKLLGLDYPAGPIIDKLAQKDQANPYFINFPQSFLDSSSLKENKYNFSFSGLKTSLYYYLKKHSNDDFKLEDLLASYQRAIVEVLLKKSLLLAQQVKAKNLFVCGGVACNSYLRKRFSEACLKENINFSFPQISYCTDNAAMIAGLGYYHLKTNKKLQDIALSSRNQYKKFYLF